MARKRGGSNNSDGGGGFFIIPPDSDGEDDDDRRPMTQFTFSQIDPDQSQFLEGPKENERKKLDSLGIAGNRAITDLSRMILFKALSGDVIDKTKCVAEALGDGMKKERVATAVLSEVEKRLRNVFGFAIRKVPAKMEEELPSRFGNRLYLINDVVDDSDGTHSLNILSSHVESSVERGVLILILAFAFCKGTAMVTSGQMKGAGKQTRWITEHHLYGLMHRVDENIPSEPSAEGRKKSRNSSSRKSLSPDDADGGVGQTPDIDALLERFVQLDYLLRDKIEEPDGREGSTQAEDGKVTAYAMGPRAAMEVGRKQIIYFCSNVLNEQPDPTMLAEVDGDEDGSDDDQQGGYEEEEIVEAPKKRSRK